MMKKKAVFLIVMLLVLGGLFPLKPATPVQAGTGDGTYTKIIVPFSGNVTVQIFNTVTNQCGGAAGVWIRPPSSGQTFQLLFSEILNNTGAHVTINNVTAGTELLFELDPGRDDICRQQLTGWNPTNPPTPITTVFQYRYYSDGHSNDPYEYTPDPNTSNAYFSHARVVPSPDLAGVWRVDFEDLPAWWPPDYDFNDLSLIVRMEGQTAEFRQNDERWSANQYATTSGTIGEFGSALTVAANISNFYGAVPVGPASLNTCMNRTDVAGYLRPSEDPNCGAGNKACMAGSLRWTRVGACQDPINPQNSLFLMRFDSKYALGGWADDPTLNRQVVADKAALKRIIGDDLAHQRPVILEVNSPTNPNGVHYVLATAKISVMNNGVLTPTFEIMDPLCNSWDTATPKNCTDPLKTLLKPPYNDNLLGIVRYVPDSGNLNNFPRKFMVIDSLPPAEGQPPADFFIIDPQGRRTGKSAVTGQLYNDIPHSGYYFQQPLADDTSVTGTTLGQGMNELYIVDPLPGAYLLYVQGTPGVNYFIDFLYETNDNSNAPVLQSYLQSGTITPNGSVRFGVDVTETAPPVFYDPVPAGPIWTSFFYLPLNGWKFK